MQLITSNNMIGLMKTFQLLALIAITASCGSQKIDNTLSNFEVGNEPYVLDGVHNDKSVGFNLFNFGIELIEFQSGNDSENYDLLI